MKIYNFWQKYTWSGIEEGAAGFELKVADFEKITAHGTFQPFNKKKFVRWEKRNPGLDM